MWRSFNNTKKVIELCFNHLHVSLCAALKMTGCITALLQYQLSEEERLPTPKHGDKFFPVQLLSSMFALTNA